MIHEIMLPMAKMIGESDGDRIALVNAAIIYPWLGILKMIGACVRIQKAIVVDY